MGEQITRLHYISNSFYKIMCMVPVNVSGYGNVDIKIYLQAQFASFW